VRRTVTAKDPVAGGDDVEAPGPATLPIRWVSNLGTDMPPEPPELVEGMLRRGELVAMAAPRAIGKTWVSFNLAALLSRGEGKVFGRLEVRQRARVLYLQGELDEWGSAVRWRHLHGHDDLDAILTGGDPLPEGVAESFAPVRIRTITRRVTNKVDGLTTSDEHVDAVIDPAVEQAIVAHDIDLVIIDPWAVYFSGKENSNDEVEAALSQLRQITLRTGVAWLVVHHISAKIESSRWTEPEDLWRGATRLADWASTRITVLPHYGEAQRKELGLSRHDARRHVDVHFLRRGLPTDDFTARRADSGWWELWDDPAAGEGDAGASTTGGRPPALSAHEVVQALIEDGGEWASMGVAAAALGTGRPAVERALHQAVRLGHVEWTTGPRGAKGVRLATACDPRETHSLNDSRETLSRESESAPDQGKEA
jgi:hypothetical protein